MAELNKPNTNPRQIEAEKRIPEEAYTYLEDRVIEQLKRDFIGRQLLYDVPVDDGAEVYKYYRQTGGMINGQIVNKGADFPQEGSKKKEDLTINIRKVGLQFKIPREDWLKDNWYNESVQDATYGVRKKLDSMIFYGDSDYGVLGIDDIVCDTVNATEEWEDVASASGTPWSDVKEAVETIQTQSNAQLERVLAADPSEAVLVINPIQYNEAFNWHEDEPFSETARHSRQMIADYVGNIFVTEQVEEGEGFVGVTGERFGKLVISEDAQVEEPEYNIRNQSFLSNIFARVVPVFPQWGDTTNETLAWVKLADL